jgi:cytochrome c553
MTMRKQALLSVAIAAVFVIGGYVGSAMAAGDVAAGKAKSAGCAGCHGANGQGVKPNPALAGKSEDEIVQALKDYKSGKRANPVMKSLATSLSDQDMANLGAYYASQKK